MKVGTREVSSGCECDRVWIARTGAVDGDYCHRSLGRSPSRVAVVSESDEGSADASGTGTSGAYARIYRVCAECAKLIVANLGDEYVSVLAIYSRARSNAASARQRRPDGRFAPK